MVVPACRLTATSEQESRPTSRHPCWKSAKNHARLLSAVASPCCCLLDACVEFALLWCASSGLCDISRPVRRSCNTGAALGTAWTNEFVLCLLQVAPDRSPSPHMEGSAGGFRRVEIDSGPTSSRGMPLVSDMGSFRGCARNRSTLRALFEEQKEG